MSGNVAASGPGAPEKEYVRKANASIITRELTGSGFHRQLKTEIKIYLPLDDLDNNAEHRGLHSCNVAWTEQLSEQVYMDLDEISEAWRLQEPLIPRSVRLVDPERKFIDVERPAEKSEPALVFVEPSTQGSTVERGDGVVVIHGVAQVPFHLRYQAARKELDYAPVSIALPRTVFVRCGAGLLVEDFFEGVRQSSPEEIPAQVGGEMPWGAVIGVYVGSEVSPALLTKVPVGRLEYAEVVSQVTGCVTLLAALFLSVRLLLLQRRSRPDATTGKQE